MLLALLLPRSDMTTVMSDMSNSAISFRHWRTHVTASELALIVKAPSPIQHLACIYHDKVPEAESAGVDSTATVVIHEQHRLATLLQSASHPDSPPSCARKASL